MAKKKKFAVIVGFTVTAESESEADAIAHLAYELRYSHTFTDARHISLAIAHEIETVPAIAEAPFADQVTVHESDGEVEQPPLTTAIEGPALEPPPPAAPELTAAFTKPGENEIPF